jgi:hypothetical protein
MNEITDDCKGYVNISEQKSFNYNNIKTSLAIVKKFIIDKGLILYGGYAIHLLMISKGSKLYSSETLPDYDFYSPNHIEDSYLLADILSIEGYKNISSISAMHILSRRVRVDYDVVADISYVAKEIFDKLPFVVIDGVKIIDVDFQKIDMHNSLSMPFLNSPYENVFNRFKKDITRLDMLNDYYPVELKKIELRPKSVKAQIQKLTSLDVDFLFSGLFVYHIFYWIYELIFGNIKSDNKILQKINSLFKDINRKDFLPVKVYELHNDDHPLMIAPVSKYKESNINLYDSSDLILILTDNIVEFEEHYSSDDYKYYNPLIEFMRPRTMTSNTKKIEVQDYSGIILTKYNIENFGKDFKGIRCCSIDLLCHFLLERYFTTKNVEYAYYYSSTINMIKNAAIALSQIEYDDAFALELSKMFPFMRNSLTYGRYLFNINDVQKQICFEQMMDKSLDKVVFREQFGYYPNTDGKTSLEELKKNWPHFDIHLSTVFYVSGKETDKFSYLVDPKIYKIN